MAEPDASKGQIPLAFKVAITLITVVAIGYMTHYRLTESPARPPLPPAVPAQRAP